MHTAGTTILLVEQNAQAALSVADRAYVLETGRITLSGTGKELMASDAVRKAYLGGLISLKCKASSERMALYLCSFAAAQNFRATCCTFAKDMVY